MIIVRLFGLRPDVPPFWSFCNIEGDTPAGGGDPPPDAPPAPAPATTVPEESPEEAITRAFLTGQIPDPDEPPASTTLPAQTGEPPAPPAADDPHARERENLARRDRELIEAQATLRAQQGQLQQYEQVLALARSGDPQKAVEALRLLGMDHGQIAEAYFTRGQQPQSDPVQTLAAEMKQLRDLVESQKQEIQNTVHSTRVEKEMSRIAQHIGRSTETYPFLSAVVSRDDDNATKALEQIFNAAVTEYTQTQKVPDYAAILKSKEEEYVGNAMLYFAEALAIPSVKDKVVQLIGQKPQAAQKPAAQAARQPQPTIGKELSDDPARVDRELTDLEAEELATKILRGEVKLPG
jgi:hypothetical protein